MLKNKARKSHDESWKMDTESEREETRERGGGELCLGEKERSSETDTTKAGGVTVGKQHCIALSSQVRMENARQ